MLRFVILACALFAAPAQAGTIDFEELGDQAEAGTINTGDNAVTFSCGTAPNTADCFTFHYGGAQTAFAPPDIPATGFGDGTSVGFVGLTDEFLVADAFDFFFQFANPITQLGFDLIDAEGPGNNFTITLFANADFTGQVSNTVFTVPSGLPDGSVSTLNAILSGTSALSARFSDVNGDPGVAIDNLNFTTFTAAVPAPPMLGLTALVLFALMRLRRRWFLSRRSIFKQVLFVSALFAIPAQAGTIDFEGLGDQVVAGTINTGDNAVTFSCGTTPNAEDCFTFEYGGVPTAFAPGDTPASGFGAGTPLGFVGLSDQSSLVPLDFFFQFASPITDLGLNIIDGEVAGLVFTVSFFANTDFTGFIESVNFVVPSGLPDGSVTRFDAILSGGAALSARFGDGRIDPGVAIDNLSFTTATAVPAPPVLGVLGLGLLSLAGLRRRRV